MLVSHITQAAADHLLVPYQEFDTDPDNRLVIEYGDGAHRVDTEGNRYLDAIGGMWCTNIGLAQEEMVEAVSEQMRKLAYANPFGDMMGVPAAELATKLATLTPAGLDHTFFSTGGSTAIDAAFRLTQFYHAVRGNRDKRHVISRTDAYHGTTYAAVSIGGKPTDHTSYFNYMSDVHHLQSPNYYRHGAGRTETEFAADLVAEFEAKVHELGGPNSVGAFFAEPIMGSGGVVLPPDNYLRQIWERCREWDILYVSDEVVTGFGRLGEWFVSEKIFGITPDIITSAKGLTSGYIPLGATIYSDAIHEVISEPGHGRYFGVGYTYSGHPVSCAAALKNIEIIERHGILERVRRTGPYFMEQLASLSDLAIVGDVRGSHLMTCVEFVADKETKASFPAAIDIGKLVASEAQKRGLIVRPIGNLNVMSPALTISESDLDQIVSILRESIVAAQALVT